MKAQDAITVLRIHADALRARGVRHAALFGSVARGHAGPESDLDIMIELDPDVAFDAFTYAGLKRYIAELFDGPVDVVNRNALRPHLRQNAQSDAIDAF